VTRGRQRSRGFFSDLVRGVSNAFGGSEVLTFLFRSRLVCSSLLHLLSSWKVNTANFALCVFSEVLHCVGPVRQVPNMVPETQSSAYIHSLQS
jgi:hypothetical protein